MPSHSAPRARRVRRACAPRLAGAGSHPRWRRRGRFDAPGGARMPATHAPCASRQLLALATTGNPAALNLVRIRAPAGRCDGAAHALRGPCEGSDQRRPDGTRRYWRPSPRRSVLERRHRLPSPDGAPEPEDAVAGVVRLLRELRVRRLPRHRVQRDPRGGRGHRRQPPLQVPDQGSRRDPPRRPGDHARRDEAQGRAGLLHAVVRRARQGHRRRDRPPRRRGRAALDRRRSPDPLADDERRRPGRGHRGRQRVGRRRSRSRARSVARCSRRRPARTSATCATSAGARARSAGTTIDVSRTGYTGDLGYELWIPAERRRGRVGRRVRGRRRVRDPARRHARARRHAARGRA